MSKSFVISASGMKNIVFASNSDVDDNFHFCIGEIEIAMKREFAEFISPLVSHIHRSDLTINTINLNNKILSTGKSKYSKIFSSDFITKINEIAEGNLVEIDEEMSCQLRIFSILVENDDLFSQIDALFPLNSKSSQIRFYIQFLQNLKPEYAKFHQGEVFDFISQNFFDIDENDLLKLPTSILYSIISNEKIKVKNEDSLFDFIQKVCSSNKEMEANDEIKIEYFYEQIEIENLSENKFNELIENLESSSITQIIWDKLKNCFCSRKNKRNINNESRYSTIENNSQENEEKTINILFENDPNNRFKGIINHITNGRSKSAIKKGIINITASSCANNSCLPCKAIEYDNDDYFHSKDNSELNEWLCVDFKKRKIKPSHYSIKSYAHENGRNYFNIQTWVIEGSNDDLIWESIDSRTNDRSLDDTNASNTFEINSNSYSNKFYRYLRIRQTGPNTYTYTNYRMIITLLEFFGTIKEA